MFLVELVIRISGFAGHTIPNTYINGEYRLEPGSKGTWVKGTSGEIKSLYQINKQGFNSIIDYSFNDTTKNYIAIIGDSYIEGLHTSIEYSIGRRIENKLNSNHIEIHEYGISGWNVYNFKELARSHYKKYDLIYILLAETDLMGGVPSKAKITGQPDILRKIYNSSHFLRYMNINRGVINSIKHLYNQQTKQQDGPTGYHEYPNYEVINQFPENCIFVYEEGKLNTGESAHTEFLQIEHDLKPIDFGIQDKHWNDNGRENCANTIMKHIEKKLFVQ